MIIELQSKAREIVEDAFRGKTDRSGKPYINHLLKVASPFCSDKRRAIALLHDILEDCDDQWNEQRLLVHFPHEVVKPVVVLTKLENESYEQYIQRVLQDEEACLIKESDLSHNMDMSRLETLTEKDIERLKKYHAAYVLIKNKNNEPTV